MAIKAGQILHIGNDTFVLDRIQSATANVNIPKDRVYELGNYYSLGYIRDIPDLGFTVESYEVVPELPALCSGTTLSAMVPPSTTIAVASNGATLPQATINVAATTGFPSTGVIYVTTTTGVQTVTYTGTTGTTFTGCAGGTGNMATGGAVAGQSYVDPSKIRPIDITTPFKTPREVDTSTGVAASAYGVAMPFLFLESINVRFSASGLSQFGYGFRGDALFWCQGQPFVTVGAVTTQATTIAAGSNAQSLPQATINVASTTGFATSGTALVVTSTGTQRVAYTGITGTTLTGCTGGTGTMSTGGAVTGAAATQTAVTFKNGASATIAQPYSENGTDVFALNVTKIDFAGNAQRLFRLADYTDTSAGVTLINTPAPDDTLRLVFSADPAGAAPTASYKEILPATPSIHSPVATGTPAAVRGRFVEIWVNGVKTGRVQDAQLNWKVNLERDEELNNLKVVDVTFNDAPEIQGSVTVKGATVVELFNAVKNACGTAANHVTGPVYPSAGVEVEFKVKDPTSGNTITAINLPSVQFDLPGYDQKVQANNTTALNFYSTDGAMRMYNGRGLRG
jgi:hypothetical protein